MAYYHGDDTWKSLCEDFSTYMKSVISYVNQGCFVGHQDGQQFVRKVENQWIQNDYMITARWSRARSFDPNCQKSTHKQFGQCKYKTFLLHNKREPNYLTLPQIQSMTREYLRASFQAIFVEKWVDIVNVLVAWIDWIANGYVEESMGQTFSDTWHRHYEFVADTWKFANSGYRNYEVQCGDCMYAVQVRSMTEYTSQANQADSHQDRDKAVDSIFQHGQTPVTSPPSKPSSRTQHGDEDAERDRNATASGSIIPSHYNKDEEMRRYKQPGAASTNHAPDNGYNSRERSRDMATPSSVANFQTGYAQNGAYVRQTWGEKSPDGRGDEQRHAVTERTAAATERRAVNTGITSQDALYNKIQTSSTTVVLHDRRGDRSDASASIMQRHTETENQLADLSHDLKKLREKNDEYEREKNLMAKERDSLATERDKLSAENAALRDNNACLKADKVSLLDKLSASMNRQLARDESDLENIAVKNRPMKILEQYEMLCSNEWLDAKTALDDYAAKAWSRSSLQEKDLCTLLCLLIDEGYKEMDILYKRNLTDLWRQAEQSALCPSRPAGRPQDRRHFETKEEGIDKDFEVAVSKLYRLNSDKPDFSTLAQDVVAAVLGPCCRKGRIDNKAQSSKHVMTYVAAALSLSWKMVLQQPPMSFDSCSLLGESVDDKKGEAHYGSADPRKPYSVVQYYVHPALNHGAKQMRKARVFLVDSSAPEVDRSRMLGRGEDKPGRGTVCTGGGDQYHKSRERRQYHYGYQYSTY